MISNDTQANFHALPAEMVTHVASFLPIEDKRSFRAVSTACRDVIDSITRNTMPQIPTNYTATTYTLPGPPRRFRLSQINFSRSLWKRPDFSYLKIQMADYGLEVKHRGSESGSKTKTFRIDYRAINYFIDKNKNKHTAFSYPIKINSVAATNGCTIAIALTDRLEIRNYDLKLLHTYWNHTYKSINFSRDETCLYGRINNNVTKIKFHSEPQTTSLRQKICDSKIANIALKVFVSLAKFIAYTAASSFICITFITSPWIALTLLKASPILIAIAKVAAIFLSTAAVYLITLASVIMATQGLIASLKSATPEPYSIS